MRGKRGKREEREREEIERGRERECEREREGGRRRTTRGRRTDEFFCKSLSIFLCVSSLFSLSFSFSSLLLFLLLRVARHAGASPSSWRGLGERGVVHERERAAAAASPLRRS
jgi:hypothetical protein